MTTIRFELEQAAAEINYFWSQLQEVKDDLLPQLTNEQINELAFACEVELRERDMKANPNQMPF